MNTAPAPSIMDIVSNNPDFFTLAGAVVAASLDDNLNGASSFLVCISTHLAFGSVDSEFAKPLLNNLGWVKHLQNLLLYHVMFQVLLMAQFRAQKTLTMLN